MHRIHIVAAARPNFMKVAPLYHALRQEAWCRPVLVHTGQHYDPEMSDAFMTDLGLPEPDISLGIGSGTHAEQTAGVMVSYEKACYNDRPDWVIVVGDVNSTMACALVAKKLCIPVAHLEAGLRSGDRTMPEEINRIVTDAISDLLWTPSADADENLLSEGVNKSSIALVGNIMIDSYEMLREKIEAEKMAVSLDLSPKEYAVVTLHRPVNVDDKEKLSELVSMLVNISKKIPLVFPMHPRTKRCLEMFGFMEKIQEEKGLKLVNPLGYIQFISLVKDAAFVITDSGGIQEETTYLNIPCLTLRESTERPITVTQGTNRLVNAETVFDNIQAILEGSWTKGACPEYWDGHTSGRIVKSLKERLKQ